MDLYRRLLIQIHKDDFACPTPARIAGVLREMPVATEVFTRMGMERGRIYHDIGCDVLRPLFDWGALERRMRCAAPEAFAMAVIVLEGDEGWEDYATLHDYVEGDR